MSKRVYLVRYGAVPEVARATASEELCCERGQSIMLKSDRGLQSAVLLDAVTSRADSRAESGLADEVTFEIVRVANGNDQLEITRRDEEHLARCQEWQQRIDEWQLKIELLDVELTLDESPKTILYVLNDRGAETTRLALLAAAAGYGVIEVQPVTAGGLTPISRGGCGSGGCGSKKH
ncbi:hypothetical protein [Lacunimicrobium album]